MFSSGQQIRRVKQSIRAGELNQACRLARQYDLRATTSGRRIADKLIDQLVQRAGRFSVSGDLESAWQDLSDASSIAVDRTADRVSRETNALIDRTVDYAHGLLHAGRPSRAASAIQLLNRRKIRDRRADEVQKVCDLIANAEQLAASGQLQDAASVLRETKNLRPDLGFLDARIRNYGYQQSELNDLTHQLRYAINDSAWAGAAELSDRMLQIAPQNQIAIDARRRSEIKQCRQSLANQPQRKPLVEEIEFIDDRSTRCDQSTRSGARSSDEDTAHDQPVSVEDQPSGESQEFRWHNGPMRSFMLWIDGVGGFLVCTGDQVTIGRAVPRSGVDIPLQADIRRHQLQIKRVQGGYMGRPLDGVPADDSGEDCWKVLGDQQMLELGRGVQGRFCLSHPLGRSARIEFVSRHRTEPWSDAVLLLGDALLMGPAAGNHIQCSGWKNQLVVYRQGDDILLRAPGRFKVNGELQTGDVVLKDGVQVVGNEFSISCEEVIQT